MFIRIKAWKVVCTKCGQVFDDDGFEEHFNTKKEAIEIITDSNWWHYRNGKAYCDKCF